MEQKKPENIAEKLAEQAGVDDKKEKSAVDKKTAKSAEKAAAKAAKNPADKTADKTAEKSAEKTAEKAAEKAEQTPTEPPRVSREIKEPAWKGWFFIRHRYLLIAILLFIAALLLDLRSILFPGLVVNAPSMDSCWNMFEAQVGISAVGLTIVSLIISIVSTTAYGMPLPKFIMEIHPKPYLQYTFVVSSIIAAVVINWTALIFGMEFTAIFIFVLTSVLAVYLTYSAMQVIYVKDDIKKEVRKHILDSTKKENLTFKKHKERWSNIDNLYIAMSKNIKTGEFIEFSENLELAEDLLDFEIDNWDESFDLKELYWIRDPEYGDIILQDKPRGKKFSENLEVLIDGAVDADNSRIAVEIMEFYYKALKIANNKKDENNEHKKVCIESFCYKIILKLFAVIDFEYLENLKIKPECTYEDFLKAQLYNHDLLWVDLYDKNTSNEAEEYALSFFCLHYTQLYYSKYKDKLDGRVYQVLINFEKSVEPESFKDYLRRFFFYQRCFDYPRKECLEELLELSLNYELDDIYSSSINLAVNISLSCLVDPISGPGFSWSKYLYICLLLYRFKINRTSDDIWCNFAETALADFYRDFYDAFISRINEQHDLGQVFTSFRDDMKKLIDFGYVGFGVDYLFEQYFNSFVVYSILMYSTNEETALNTLEVIYGKDTFNCGTMYFDFIGVDGYHMKYTGKKLLKFAEVFGIAAQNELDDRRAERMFTELRNIIIERKDALSPKEKAKEKTDTKNSDRFKSVLSIT